MANKRLLIISPYFPPVNAADMQRIRMSLPYFKASGWEAEVIMVHENYVDMVKDPLLLACIPNDVPIHKVKALPKKWTSKFGLGSIALRSLWSIRKKGNQLLKHKNFDLIYFSTTQFPVCILGPYWKRRFNIPYIVDIQDPWHSEYYQSKPKAERPKKYWFSYRLNKYLEPKALKDADGLISVSEAYIDTLHERYPVLKEKPASIIMFGAYEADFDIAKSKEDDLTIVYNKDDGFKHLVYIGRGGNDMSLSLNLLFKAFAQGLKHEPILFNQFRMHFIGTSYAPKGKGVKTIMPLATQMGLANYIQEHTDRIGFYDSIKHLQHAHGLIIIGSEQASYTASKLYPYILAKKPLLGIFHQESNAYKILSDCRAGQVIGITQGSEAVYQTFRSYIEDVTVSKQPLTNWEAFKPFTASYLTAKQTAVFEQVINLYQQKR
ncbi:Glycosyltransferase Family 4 [Pedobacter terrae]|uniref:Glycosyltransferase Family 4 n=1 Tax=Pedobacter terrae TaxID=405671 RepID=A0A1G7U4B8_9SPHI|nr:glycosyltransferase [Pedobacter terrae]SDG42303.1 Glycosyltransferase Family 4 [Pedobacter terrae]